MSQTRNRKALLRQWQLVALVHATKVGRTISQLIERLSASRATVYRDIELLEQAGVRFAVDTVNGEKRYRLLEEPLPSLVSPVRRHALTLACEALSAFKGTSLLRELERIRDERPPKSPCAPIVVQKANGRVASAQVLNTVERALSETRALTLQYRGASDDLARARHVAPLELRLAKGQVYLLANELETDEQRTFKLARIEEAHLGDRFDRSQRVPAPMERAVVTWSGEVVEVVVRVSAEGARFVHEFPLIAGQRLEHVDNGAVEVRAEVAGIEEALKWVLSWGHKAVVLAPPALRRRAKQELSEALAGYAPAGLRRGVSQKVRHKRESLANGGRRHIGVRPS